MYISDLGEWKAEYELELTNFEVKVMFRNMVKKWFAGAESNYNDFIKALLMGDVKAMNLYMNRIALAIFSYFDIGKNHSGIQGTGYRWRKRTGRYSERSPGPDRTAEI